MILQMFKPMLIVKSTATAIQEAGTIMPSIAASNASIRTHTYGLMLVRDVEANAQRRIGAITLLYLAVEGRVPTIIRRPSMMSIQ